MARGEGTKQEKQGAPRLRGHVQATQFWRTDGIEPAQEGRATAALEDLFGRPPGVLDSAGIDAQELLHRQVPACPAGNVGKIGRVQQDNRLRLADTGQRGLQQPNFTDAGVTIEYLDQRACWPATTRQCGIQSGVTGWYGGICA